MMKLHSTIGKRTKSGGHIYCGPTAVMTITGKPYLEVQKAINKNRWRNPTAAILGMQASDLVRTMQDFGYLMTPLVSLDGQDFKDRTLAAVLRDRTDTLNHCHIIKTRNHFITVCGNYYMDNHTMKPVFVSQAPNRRARVKNIWRVTEMK